MIDPQEIVNALGQLMPLELDAAQLLTDLTAVGELSPEQLIDLSPRLETACLQAEQVAEASQKVVLRCLGLTPRPSPRVPLGF